MTTTNIWLPEQDGAHYDNDDNDDDDDDDDDDEEEEEEEDIEDATLSDFYDDSKAGE